MFEAKTQENIFTHHTVISENTRIGINPSGGYVTSWAVRNESGNFNENLYKGTTLKRTGIPLLFPNYGTVDNLPNHGFGRDLQWSLETPTTSSAVMRLRTVDLPEPVKEHYPHNFEAAICIQAENTGGLKYSLAVQNLGNTEMPIHPGLHPYWRVNHQDKKLISTEDLPNFDATKIDWENNPPDTAYAFNGKALINFPDRILLIEELGPEKVIQYLVAWSQTTSKPDYDFVAFEPITKLDKETDIFSAIQIDRSPIILPPKSEWQMNLRFSTQ